MQFSLSLAAKAFYNLSVCTCESTFSRLLLPLFGQTKVSIKMWLHHAEIDKRTYTHTTITYTHLGSAQHGWAQLTSLSSTHLSTGNSIHALPLAHRKRWVHAASETRSGTREIKELSRAHRLKFFKILFYLFLLFCYFLFSFFLVFWLNVDCTAVVVLSNKSS